MRFMMQRARDVRQSSDIHHLQSGGNEARVLPTAQVVGVPSGSNHIHVTRRCLGNAKNTIHQRMYESRGGNRWYMCKSTKTGTYGK